MRPAAGQRIWIGGFPPPPGWDQGVTVGDGLVLMRMAPEAIERVSVPCHVRHTAEALAEWIAERGLGRIVVEVRA